MPTFGIQFINFILNNTSVKQIDCFTNSLFDNAVNAMLQSDSLESIDFKQPNLEDVAVTALGKTIKHINISDAYICR